MNTHFGLKAVRSGAGNALTFVFVLCMMAAAGLGQVPQTENISVGALVIPTESIKQGKTADTSFDLRAYDLANFLRQNNIPLKWAIKSSTVSDDFDFVANVTRISGSGGVARNANMKFSGGAFIIAAEYDNQPLRDLITSFNAGGSEVVVYKTTVPTRADISYTLTTKSRSAIGPDGRNFGEGIHQNHFGFGGSPDSVAGQPSVDGYKSVRRSNIRSGGPSIVAGDTLEWTIDYVNNSPVDITNFNIRDEISVVDGDFTGNLTLVAGSNIVTALSGGATAARNTSFDGIGDDSTSDLLAAGAILPIGGRIQVKVQTTINLSLPGGQPYPDGQILYNQTLARGNQITGVVKSDAIDWTNTAIFGIDIPPTDSLLQLQDANIFNATIARIKAPTRANAFIEGQVRTAKGNPIANALVTVTSAANGELRTVRTNAQGNFIVEELEVGILYIVNVQHKRYVFDADPVMFTLVDNVTGLSFVGVVGQGSEGVAAVRSAEAKPRQ